MSRTAIVQRRRVNLSHVRFARPPSGIAKFLAHALVKTTECCVHLSDRSVSDNAERVSVRVEAAPAGSGDSPMPTVEFIPRAASATSR